MLYNLILGFDDQPVFNNGLSQSSANIDTLTQVIKAGSETHLTRGLPVAYGIQVRPLSTSLGIPRMRKTYPMKGQIEIASLDGHASFQLGDSGSAVFTVKQDRTLECIGMAIGYTTYNSVIVTPIQSILDALAPGVRLKTFPN